MSIETHGIGTSGPVRIAIIGAGSATFAATVVRDLCVHPRMGGSHVALMDVDGHRLDMVHGLYWGRLIHEFRKIFLSMAIFSGYKLVKVDSPDEWWNMQLYDFEDVLHRMISLQNEDSLDDKDYLWYRQSCLRSLSIGLKR